MEGLAPGGGGGAGLLDSVDLRDAAELTTGLLRGDGSGLFRLLLIVFNGLAEIGLKKKQKNKIQFIYSHNTNVQKPRTASYSDR